jgi:hypothetical protein
LLSRRRPLSPREDERERITSARQAADALFKTRRQVTQQSVTDAAPSVDLPARKPRVLRAAVPPQECKSSIEPEQRIIPELPSSQFARIRAWVRYGMSVAQVAAVYGVGVDIIERILAEL